MPALKNPSENTPEGFFLTINGLSGYAVFPQKRVYYFLISPARNLMTLISGLDIVKPYMDERYYRCSRDEWVDAHQKAERIFNHKLQFLFNGAVSDCADPESGELYTFLLPSEASQAGHNGLEYEQHYRPDTHYARKFHD